MILLVLTGYSIPAVLNGDPCSLIMRSITCAANGLPAYQINGTLMSIARRIVIPRLRSVSDHAVTGLPCAIVLLPLAMGERRFYL
jgi:hypothetical protein